MSKNGGISLRKYVVKRILLSVLILICVTFIIYGLLRCLPSSYVENMAMQLSTKPGAKSYDEWLSQLNAAYGLDKGIIPGYFTWLGDAVRGHFGDSWKYTVPVTQKFGETIWLSFIMGLISFALELVIAIPLGIIAATKQYSITDSVSMVLALLGVATPNFWLGLMLIIGFSLHLKWFPSGGDAGWRALVLPVITLGTGCMASITRITRSSMLEVVRQDYIRTAKAKGVSSRVVIYKHALKNALIPVVTVVGLQFGSLLGGAVLTESVFSWPGVGTYLVNSIKAKDTPAVLGCVIIFCICFSIVNLVVDILYAYIDPRIKSKYK